MGDEFHFTVRPAEILRLLPRGSRVKEVAAALDLSPCTVRTYLQRLFPLTNCTESQKRLPCGFRLPAQMR